MAEEVGVAFVSLVPSARGFSKLAQREIRNELRGTALVVPITPEVKSTAPVRIPAVIDPDRTEVIGGTVRVPADVDPGQLRDETTSAIRTVEATRPTIDVRVDADPSLLGRLLGGKATTIVERDGRSLGARIVEAIGGGITSSGSSASGGLLSGISTVGSAVGGTLMSTISAAAIPLAPFVGFGIAVALSTAVTAALVGGAGVGAIGLGAWLLKEDPQVVAAATNLATTVKAVFTDAAQPLVQPFVESLGIFRDLAVELAPDIKETFAAIAPAITPLARGFAGLIREAMPGILALVRSAVPFLKDLESTLPQLGSRIGAFLGMIATNGPQAAQIFRDLLNLTGIVIQAVGLGIAFFSSFYITVRNIVFGMLDLGRQFALGWEANINDVMGFFGRLRDFIAGVWRTVSADTNNVVSMFRGLPGRIKNAVGNMGNLLYQAGRNVVAGLINGIQAMFGQLANTASNMAGIIRNYLPFSPAKEGPLSGSGNPFVSGQTIAQMLAGGMESQLPMVSSASSQLASAVTFGGRSSGAAAAAAPRLNWAPGATGDRLLDAIREIIRVDWGGDPTAALGSA